MTKPGTKPLVTISANESSCKPNSLCTSNFLANRPSKKSKKIPRKTNNAVSFILPFTEKITAMLPQNKFNSVIKFGMCLFKRSILLILVKITNYFCVLQYP